MFYDQSSYDLRFEWGLHGVRHVGRGADVLILIDVLSFSTCVDVAVARGSRVVPCRWKKDERAADLAKQMSAELAVSRGKPGKFTLSPGSMMSAKEGMSIV